MITFHATAIAAYEFFTIAILAIWLPESIYKKAHISIWAVVLVAISCIFEIYYSVVKFRGILYLLSLGFVYMRVKHQSKWIGACQY